MPKLLSCTIGQFFARNTCTPRMLPERPTYDTLVFESTIGPEYPLHGFPGTEDHTFEESSMILAQTAKLARITAQVSLAITLYLTAASLPAQEARKAISHPAPPYPETARRFNVTGVVKVQVVIAPDGQIKTTKIIGGHPLLVNAVEETLKNWKYAPASTETTALLEFSFRQ
jgi:TonB family protein